MLLAAQTPNERRPDLSAYADNAFALAHALTLDASAASRIVEKVFERAHSRQPPTDISVREWVLTLVRNEAVLHSRDNANMQAGAADFDRTIIMRRIRRMMSEAFSSLDADDRAILVLADVERLDYRSVGQIIGTDLESVKVLHRLAESRLRAAISRRLPEGDREGLQHLSAAVLRDAVAEMAAHDLPSLPPTTRLQPAAGSAKPERPGASTRARRKSPAVSTAALRNVGIGFLVIFFAGLFAYGAVRLLERPPDVGAISVTVRAAEEPPRIMYPTDDRGRAAEYIASELDWRLTVPRIEGASLQGASRHEIIRDTFIPLLTYHDEATNELIPVFVYDYALLGRVGDRLRFEAETLRQIEDENHFELHDMGSKQVLVWRNRDDIFVAVTRGGAEALQDRIYVAP